MATVIETSKSRVAPSGTFDRAWRPNFKSKQLRAFRTPILVVASLTLFFSIWQILSFYLFNPYLIPPPTKVFETAVPMILSGEIFRHAGISLMRVLIGFSLGSISAIVIGVIMGRLRIVNELLDPIIEFLRYLSPTAMIPIAVIWFGIGEQSKYFLIFWGTFFFVLINTIAGVMRTPVARERAAQCLGAGQLQIFLTVVIPSAVPYIITGMRVAMASSFMSIIPAEMLAARSGLGYLLQVSGMLVQTDRIFVALAAISLLGFLTDRLFRFLVNRTLSRYMAFVTTS
jgi:NitT/TauT family transport system permease protein/taurine transport system permease protein